MSQNDKTIFKHNDFEAEFDFTDADDMELYEKSVDQLNEEEKRLPKTGNVSSIIRSQCAWLRRFFDRIFGTDSGKKICGEKDNFGACMEAYRAFLVFVSEQKQGYISNANEIREKYSANRAQRRHPAATQNSKKN